MRDGQSGFTLVEVLIALVLFSLIGIAGFSLLNAVVGVQSRIDGRLDRLAEMQRAMHVMMLDFQQVADTDFVVEKGATTMRRYSIAGGPSTLLVRYDIEDGALTRTLSPDLGSARQAQALIPGVKQLQWSFFNEGVWTDVWPPVVPNGGRHLPMAVALEVTVEPERAGLGGTLKRVVLLPAETLK